jgi:PAS domain S-box-containing protein
VEASPTNRIITALPRTAAFVLSPAALIALLVGLAAAAGAWYAARQFEDIRIERAIQIRIDWRTRDIEAKLQAMTAPVVATAAYLRTNAQPTAGEFRRFVREMAHGDGALLSVLWAPLVPQAERAAFEMMAYRIVDASGASAKPEDAYLPVLHIETFGRQTVPAGLDLWANPVLKVLIENARRTGGPSVMPSMELIGAQGTAPLRIVAAPVYGSAAGSEAQGALLGFVVGHWRIDDALNAAIEGTPNIPETMRFYLGRPGFAPADDLAAAFDPVRQRFSTASPRTVALPDGAVPSIETIQDFDHRWLLEFAFSNDFGNSLRSSAPWFALLAVLALTLLVFCYIVYQRVSRARIEDEVVARTRALSDANRQLASEIAERSRVEIELRRQAQWTDTALEALPVAVIFVDTDRNVQFWSAAAERIFGYSAAEILRKPYALTPDKEMPPVDRLFAAVEGGVVVRDRMIVCQDRDGKGLHVRFSGAPLYGDRVLRGSLIVLEDVTQAKQTEDQLFQAQKMDALGQLTGGLAHDFNNLLLVIMGNIQLLREERAGDAAVENFATEAYNAALRGADLVRSMLAFARRQPLQPRPVDINKTVSSTAQMLRRVLGERVEISLTLDREPWMVRVDPTQLEAALANLATNARDAMPKGGRLSIVTTRRRLDADYAMRHPDVVEGDYMMLQVSDTGSGISAENMKKVFDPFFTTKEAGRGSGLGLSMVFGFIKQSGGHINVYSEVGVGTTFRLYLPRHYLALETPETMPEAVGVGGSETILAVEDDPGIRRLVRIDVESFGYKVLMAENAADALQVLESGVKIDLLFSDIVMAGKIDGLALARLVRQRWPAIRILLTSGFPDTDIDDGSQMGENFALLSKPYRKPELAKALRAALDGQS